MSSQTSSQTRAASALSGTVSASCQRGRQAESAERRPRAWCRRPRRRAAPADRSWTRTSQRAVPPGGVRQFARHARGPSRPDGHDLDDRRRGDLEQREVERPASRRRLRERRRVLRQIACHHAAGTSRSSTRSAATASVQAPQGDAWSWLMTEHDLPDTTRRSRVPGSRGSTYASRPPPSGVACPSIQQREIRRRVRSPGRARAAAADRAGRRRRAGLRPRRRPCVRRRWQRAR